MPNPLEVQTVTAAQLILLAANVNDRRVISEAQALAREAGADEQNVSSITYEPARPPRLPKLSFTVYKTDEAGNRMAVHDDGTPYDPNSGKAYRIVTDVVTVTFKGDLPVWWMQAARIVPPSQQVGAQA